MAKLLLKKTVEFCFLILYYIIRPSYIRYITKVRDFLYTSWRKNELIYCGLKPLFTYPLFLTNAKYISVGDNFRVKRGGRLEVINPLGSYLPIIRIGNNVSINWYCHIGASNEIVIGNNVLIGSNVLITDHSHGEITSDAIQDAPSNRAIYSKGKVIIEDNVWIGEGVAIMPGVRIGANSIVGANAVVTRSIPPNSVVAGNPAKVLKML